MSQEQITITRSLLWLRLGVVLAVALPLALFAAMSWMAYRDAQRVAATRLDELTRAMEEHAERALATNAMVLRELRRFRGREPRLRELLDAIRDRLPHLRAITLRGAGRFELELEPAHFADFYSRLTKPESEVAFRLMTGDGHVLARWPAVPVSDETYSASRAVGNHAVFVSATQPPHVVLGPWRRQTAVLAAIALPSAAALLYAMLLALRRTRRMQEEAEQRARAEEALRHSQKMEALGELTGGVAHDFTNLLAVVSNNAHLLAEALPQGTEHPRLASIFRALESGTRLTRQLLTFARRQPLNPELVELQRALPGMLELLRSTSGSGVSLGVHVAPDTPRVHVDPAELEMALINLVANARDAMSRSGQLEILARAAEPGEGPQSGRQYAIISVSDTGRGIEPQNLSRVFDPFFTTKPAGSGTGLGLSQVYGFCQQAGGAVQLESDIGVGTTVSLFLPASIAVSQAVTKSARSPSAAAA